MNSDTLSPKNEGVNGIQKSRNFTLKSQLSKDFSASLIKAPVQIQLLKGQLAPKILGICQPLPPRKKDLCLHSIAFFGEEVSNTLIDPLGQLVGRKFFSQDLHLNQSDSISQDTIQSHLVLNFTKMRALQFAVTKENYIKITFVLPLSQSYFCTVWRNFKSLASRDTNFLKT